MNGEADGYVSFDQFDLDPRCLSALRAQDIWTPAPIQAQAIPPIFAGRDTVVTAETGAGKTLAFAVPAFSRLMMGPLKRNMMLVLAPSPDFVEQLRPVLNSLGRAMGLRVACAHQGTDFAIETAELRNPAAVIAATPTRLLEHVRNGVLDFGELVTFVVDEADRILDMGLLSEIRHIADRLPAERQTVVCSGTLPETVARLADEFLREPAWVSVGPVAEPVSSAPQLVYIVKPEDKLGLLKGLVGHKSVTSGIVFVSSNARTERVTKALRKEGRKTQAIHGERTQSQRDQTVRGFQEGRCRFLVTTDPAMRGLDIEGVSHVFSFDLPNTAEDYLNRIGRVARLKGIGHAITLCTPGEEPLLLEIEEDLGTRLERATL